MGVSPRGLLPKLDEIGYGYPTGYLKWLFWPRKSTQCDWEIQSRANARSLRGSVLASVYEGFGRFVEGPSLSARSLVI